MSAWSYDIKSRKSVRLDVPVDADGYICRMFPTKDASRVLFMTLNRHQDNMRIYDVNPRSTIARMIISEEVDKYVIEAAYDNIHITANNILMLSDRDGYRHLYLYNMNGILKRSVCPASTDITAVYGYDEKTGDIFYQAAPTPMTRHIFVQHANGKTQRLSQREGVNDARFSTSSTHGLTATHHTSAHRTAATARSYQHSRTTRTCASDSPLTTYQSASCSRSPHQRVSS